MMSSLEAVKHMDVISQRNRYVTLIVIVDEESRQNSYVVTPHTLLISSSNPYIVVEFFTIDNANVLSGVKFTSNKMCLG